MSTAVASIPALRLRPLDVVFETPGLPAFDLPDELDRVYGGPLGFPAPRLLANLRASDAVAATPPRPRPGRWSAAGGEHDRFLTGLLRACADVVLIGAGALHASPRTRWTPEHSYPPAAELFAELRRRRGRPPQPTVAVLSGSGRIDPQHPGLRERTLVLTSEQGAARLGGRLPHTAAIVPLAEQAPIDPTAALEALRAAGHHLVLCEGGPSVFGAFASAGLVDELFLTFSPQLLGWPATERRLSLLEGAVLPGQTSETLLSLRRSDSHLFLRYALRSRPGGSDER